jgi:ATP adenylyltransferase
LGYIRKEESAPEADRSALAWRPGADRECFLCRAIADDHDRENLVVARTSHTVTILNRYPYNNGHLLVAPLDHRADLGDLSDGEHADLMRQISGFIAHLRSLMNAEGFNVGINLGRVAGAGLPGHLHWHVVPRWSGDTNFMPVLDGVRVIPQSLDALWALIGEQLGS